MDEKFTPEEIAESLRHHIDQESCLNCPLYMESNCTEMMHDTAADMLVELAAEVARLREERRWIPTSERLPDQELEAEPKNADGKPLLGGYECIALIEGAKRPTALWYCRIDGEGVWTDESGENFYRVTHWKPMPKGPEAE